MSSSRSSRRASERSRLLLWISKLVLLKTPLSARKGYLSKEKLQIWELMTPQNVRPPSLPQWRDNSVNQSCWGSRPGDHTSVKKHNTSSSLAKKSAPWHYIGVFLSSQGHSDTSSHTWTTWSLFLMSHKEKHHIWARKLFNKRNRAVFLSVTLVSWGHSNDWHIVNRLAY